MKAALVNFQFVTGESCLQYLQITEGTSTLTELNDSLLTLLIKSSVIYFNCFNLNIEGYPLKTFFVMKDKLVSVEVIDIREI